MEIELEQTRLKLIETQMMVLQYQFKETSDRLAALQAAVSEEVDN